VVKEEESEERVERRGERGVYEMVERNSHIFFFFNAYYNKKSINSCLKKRTVVWMMRIIYLVATVIVCPRVFFFIFIFSPVFVTRY
jgi:hypothetical protein